MAKKVLFIELRRSTPLRSRVSHAIMGRELPQKMQDDPHLMGAPSTTVARKTGDLARSFACLWYKPIIDDTIR